MFLARILLFSIITFAFQFANAGFVHANEDVTVTFSDLRPNDSGKVYTLAVVRLRLHDEKVSSPNRRLARSILEIASNWSADVFRDRYTDESVELAEAMRRAGIKLTTNSALIVAFDSSAPTKPLGTLWTAYPDSNGKLNLEKALDWTYPERETRVGPYAYFEKNQERVVGIRHAQEVQGGVVEFKRLVLDPSSPRELMPALLLKGETAGHNVRPFMKNGVRVLPSEYALYCHRKLVPIYLRFGFKLVQPEPIKGDYVMSIDREGYVQNSIKWLEKAKSSGWDIRFDTHVRTCEGLF